MRKYIFICIDNIDLERINIALDFLDLTTKTMVIGAPHQALHLIGAKDLLAEAKTFRWQSGAHRMITGYVAVPGDKVLDFMKLSGNAGIFLQRLAADGPAPEVEWLKWNEKQPHAEDLKQALEQAKAKNSYLAYRRGGGDCIGIVVEGLLHKFRLWEVWGIPTDFGPSTVCQILGELKWEIHNRPTPPLSKSRPWIFHGRPAETTDSVSYSYDINSADGKLKFLRITMHHKHRKVEEEVQTMPGHWWDAASELTITPTVRYAPEVAPTLVDTQMEGTEDTTSPLKKRSRTEEPKFRCGPGGLPVIDLGGYGDCGYRCLAYGIACCNTKEWAGDVEAEKKFTGKVHELGQILRTQVVHQLLNVDGSWKASWSPDPAATTRTEGGTVATDISSFEMALRREQRWICGLTMQTACSLKRVNAVIWEWKEGSWCRTACVGSLWRALSSTNQWL